MSPLAGDGVLVTMPALAVGGALRRAGGRFIVMDRASLSKAEKANAL
ncbi:hypothetical protein QE363_003693 [Sphingomonas sp. SORGH_AS870]|nr:hypothetical protein [Sphingomonas sp. SORGH_AS_0870]MDR6147900.1 hypothetical protein [Sphingomonas sp. SORGH_AS_0870]